MAYVEGRLVYDADSHIHEPPGYAEHYADPSIRAELAERLATFRKPPGIDEALAKQRDPEFRAKDADEILLRKNSLAVGAVIPEDRSHALDLLGFAAQLVFTTTHLDPLREFDVNAEVELAAAMARAHNRGLVDFCSADRRLLPGCFVPFAHIEQAAQPARAAIALGAAAHATTRRVTSGSTQCGRRRRRRVCRSSSTSVASSPSTRSTRTTVCR